MIICKKYKFPVLYINQFYPRPGTPAAKMKRVPTQDVKQRTKKLTEYFHSYEPYKKRIGEKYTVLVTDIAHDRKHYVGHNEFYEQVRMIYYCLLPEWVMEITSLVTSNLLFHK